MPIRVVCECGNVVEVADSFAGRSGTCRRCGATMAIPRLDELGVVDPDSPPVARARRSLLGRLGCFGKAAMVLLLGLLTSILILLVNILMTFNATSNFLMTWLTHFRRWLGF